MLESTEFVNGNIPHLLSSERLKWLITDAFTEADFIISDLLLALCEPVFHSL